MRNNIRPDARSLPMPVPYVGGILSGQGMMVSAFFGIAAADALQNVVVECEVIGEFEITKEAPLVIAQGVRVFWDNTNRSITLTATANFQVGICTVAALSADTTVRVWLNRVPVAGA